MRAETHRRYLWLIMGSLATLAWLVLWIGGGSPYAHTSTTGTWVRWNR